MIMVQQSLEKWIQIQDTVKHLYWTPHLNQKLFRIVIQYTQFIIYFYNIDVTNSQLNKVALLDYF